MTAAYNELMETSYLELKQKEVVNLCDGKRLGRVCDVVFTFPEGRTLGIVVPGSRGFRFGRAELFIALKDITKIGVDVILVDIHSAPKPEKRRGRELCPPRAERYSSSESHERRDYGEYE